MMSSQIDGPTSLFFPDPLLVIQLWGDSYPQMQVMLHVARLRNILSVVQDFYPEMIHQAEIFWVE